MQVYEKITIVKLAESKQLHLFETIIHVPKTPVIRPWPYNRGFRV